MHKWSSKEYDQTMEQENEVEIPKRPTRSSTETQIHKLQELQKGLEGKGGDNVHKGHTSEEIKRSLL